MKAQECTATKVCNECGKRKPQAGFDQNRKTRKCKTCEAKASRQRYLRNREKVLARGAVRRVEKAAEIKAAMADWYKRNREHVRKRGLKYRQRKDVRERERERQRKRYAANRKVIQAKRREYYKANPEAAKRFAEYQERYYRENPEMYVARCGKRRSAKLKAIPAWANLKAIRKIYKQAADLTKKTGVQHHVDHIIPLQGRTVCGLHVENNLRVIPAKENLSKFNRLVEDIVQSHQ